MAEPEYNEETCITAGELRSMGLPIPEKIPDCAWIPRNSWGIDEVEAEQAVLDPSVLVCKLKMHFYEPFRWVHLELEIPPDGD